MRLGSRGKLRLIASLAGQLAESREREGILRERLDWYAAALNRDPFPALRLVPDQPARRSPSAARIS